MISFDPTETPGCNPYNSQKLMFEVLDLLPVSIPYHQDRRD
jgi:hypothetical protein